MAKVTYKDKIYECDPEKSLLTNVLEQGGFIPYSCREGVCHACMMCAVEGNPPEEAQNGLDERRKQQNCFLSCQCKSEEDMTITAPPATVKEVFTAKLISRQNMGNDIHIIRFSIPDNYTFSAGQFINITNPANNKVRSYSIASLPDEGFIELHVRCYADGQVSQWLCHELEEGDAIEFKGAFGECYYGDPSLSQPLVLAATGTGLAPLLGILKSALAAGHQAPVYLFHFSSDLKFLYLHHELEIYAQEHTNVQYIPGLENEPVPESGKQGLPVDIVRETLGRCEGYRAFVCGNPVVVEALSKLLFASGVSKDEIFSDPFITQK